MTDDKMPTHYEIMNYWRHKTIEDNNTIEDCPEFCSNVIPDPDIPQCFACGQLILSNEYLDDLIDSVWNSTRHKNKTDEEKADFVLKRMWNDAHVKHHLQKCHIYPRALGGSNDVSNLFLMCGTCHKDSPDTVFTEQFYEFVRKRRKDGNKYIRAYRDAQLICDNYGIDSNDLANAIKDIDIFDYMNTHGFDYTQSSITAVYVAIAKEKTNGSKM